MAEPVSETSSEENLATKEPAEADPTSLQQKQARRRRHRRRCSDSFAIYFPKVLKQVHEGLSLSRETVSVMDSFVKDIFERIADEAGRLVLSSKRCTMSHSEIQTAVRLLLPGELGRYAVSEGTKAFIRYISRG